ncbi:response regulator transcription factor [Paenibacillus sp. OV219]|uniref:response regulator transcription factor n=1 Tax=Paenibacillus sp. OV219 TaxID=1884377 RepID=UPI0008C8429E|nr:response regulator transcription factor [Paenibacillus sp. OV219]SEM53532.1 DNA-binding response regulator, OmpR family, contains REC and winged-helix (wHTH) domain [Paenibacillus sp. OV219]
MRQILLIEDEPNFARFLELELKHEGFDVTVCHDGREGFAFATEREWDMLLLDLMLPGLSGIEICRRLRSQKNKTPIIMLTARNSVMDRVTGLDSGADDYLPKPFEIEELLARMRAIFRRIDDTEESTDGIVRLQDLQVELPSRTVSRDGVEIPLTKREFDLLLVLIRNANNILSRDQLLDLVWGFETGVETNIVDVYIRYVRQKLGDGDKYIQTVRGVGYIMKG